MTNFKFKKGDVVEWWDWRRGKWVNGWGHMSYSIEEHQVVEYAKRDV
jgi:hypothetical protein